MYVPISEVKKRKKKKKDGSVDSTDMTDECTNEEPGGKKVCILCGFVRLDVAVSFHAAHRFSFRDFSWAHMCAFCCP